MIFDTHAHYDDEQFDEDRDSLLCSMQEGGVGTIVNAGSDVASWEDVRALTARYPFIYGAAGVHPDDVGELNEENFRRLRAVLQEEKMVAVGEIGLDYYWDNESHEVQKTWFIRQLELARELDMPVIIHSREAAADTLQIMKEHARGLEGVIHCFSYSAEMAREYVKMEKAGADKMELEKFTLGSLRRAVAEGDVKNGSLMAGQVAGMVKEILPVRTILENIVREYEDVRKA